MSGRIAIALVLAASIAGAAAEAERAAIRLANAALGVAGNMAGMDRVTRAGDCLGDTRNDTVVCTYGANAAKDQTVAICGMTPRDEPTMLATAYGCRP